MKYFTLDIKDHVDVRQLIREWKATRPHFVSFDTETNGLNVHHHKPFLISFGYVNNTFDEIHTYTLDYELASKQVIRDTIYVIRKMFKKAKKIIGHNISYDIHMQRNIGYPFNFWSKFTDTQFYIRLAHDAKIPEEGGAPLKLKEYTVRYIDPTAKYFEGKLKDEIKVKKSNATKKLKEALRGQPLYEGYHGKAKSWTKKVVDDYVDDKLNELRDLDSKTAYIISEWIRTTPSPNNYQLLNRANVTEYAHYDVIYTLLIFLKLKDIIVERGQQDTLKREERAIRPLYELESNGVHFNYPKALLAKERMRDYILSLRTELQEIAGQPLRVGQHQIIKDVLLFKYHLNFANTTKDTLELIFTMDDVDPKAVRFVEIVGELRSLEKWYSTYLIRWIKESQEFGAIVYPTYHQAGTVTGRVSSAFQQFPKKGKYTIDGEYLFHPRELFIPPPGRTTFFFDYKAMEMRILAIYTILIGHPDINLVRAFQPYNCYRYGIVNDRWMFDNKEPNWQQYEWFKEENDEKWEPTDIHALTACKAFDVTPDVENFKDFYRQHGKTTNFSIIYGATPKTIAKKQKVSMQQAQKLYNAYFDSYPSVRKYGEYIRTHINLYGYIGNLFNRKYYGCNAHKGKNYPIQGSGADYTKDLMADIGDMIRPLETSWQGYLHDEFSFDIPPEERYLIPIIKEMMERLDVPITMEVDVEYTTTNWMEKHKYVVDTV